MQSLSENWLSLDLSSSLGTMALHRWNAEKDEPTLVCEKIVSDGFQSSEKFLPVLKDLCEAQKLELRTVTRLITTSGPGSFTGLRIAFASFKAMAMVHSLPIETVGSSEARALAWMQKNPDKNMQPTVVTQVASTRFSISPFPYNEEKVIEIGKIGTALAKTETLLLDDKAKLELFPDFDVVRFPLRAEYLGRYLFRAKSRATSSTLGEQIALSPNYYGNSKYGN